MDDKVKVRCPKCTKVFRERASIIRDGSQINCQHCNRLLSFNRDAEDPFIRRALKSAKEVRDALQALRTPAAYTSEA